MLMQLYALYVELVVSQSDKLTGYLTDKVLATLEALSCFNFITNYSGDTKNNEITDLLILRINLYPAFF